MKRVREECGNYKEDCKHKWEHNGVKFSYKNIGELSGLGESCLVSTLKCSNCAKIEEKEEVIFTDKFQSQLDDYLISKYPIYGRLEIKRTRFWNRNQRNCRYTRIGNGYCYHSSWTILGKCIFCNKEMFISFNAKEINCALKELSQGDN